MNSDQKLKQEIKETIQAIRSTTAKVLAGGPEACREYLKGLGLLDESDESPILDGEGGEKQDTIILIAPGIQEAAALAGRGAVVSKFKWEKKEFALIRDILTVVQKLLNQSPAPQPEARWTDEDIDTLLSDLNLRSSLKDDTRFFWYVSDPHTWLTTAQLLETYRNKKA